MQGAEFAAKMRGSSEFEAGGQGLLVCGNEPDFSQAFRFESMLVIRVVGEETQDTFDAVFNPVAGFAPILLELGAGEVQASALAVIGLNGFGHDDPSRDDKIWGEGQ
jgi:hypothetical protein